MVKEQLPRAAEPCLPAIPACVWQWSTWKGLSPGPCCPCPWGCHGSCAPCGVSLWCLLPQLNSCCLLVTGVSPAVCFHRVHRNLVSLRPLLLETAETTNSFKRCWSACRGKRQTCSMVAQNLCPQGAGLKIENKAILTESPPACSLDNARKHVKLYIGKVWRELQAGSQPLQIWRAAGICIGLREKHQLGVSCGLLSGG